LMTYDHAERIHNTLKNSRPFHPSPFEHIATPDRMIDQLQYDGSTPLGKRFVPVGWEHPELHGNLYGWVQYRKTMLGEAVASLPEGYSL